MNNYDDRLIELILSFMVLQNLIRELIEACQYVTHQPQIMYSFIVFEFIAYMDNQSLWVD